MQLFCASALPLLMLSACGGSERAKAAGRADSATAAASPSASTGGLAADAPQRTLAVAAGAQAYRVDNAAVAAGSISGDVQSDEPLPSDTTVTPVADSATCAPFQDVTLPRARGAKADAPGTIGNAVVWLVGVTHGPRDNAPRRLGLRLNRCQLEPRVQRAPAGATVIASTHDNVSATLRFDNVGDVSSTPRAVVSFTDPGQVVPTSAALANPGLVEIHDNRHPWIRGFIAVAPHPFVAVTDADGKFSFENVPAGSYQLVAWHERLGTRVMPVTVGAGGALKVRVTLSPAH